MLPRLLAVLAVWATRAAADASLLPARNRVAVIVHGESFREHAAQHVRDVGVEGWEAQRAASLSHIEQAFLPLVFRMNYSGVDLFLETYDTPWLPDLVAWYGPYAARNGSVVARNFSTGVFDFAAGTVGEVLAREEHAALLVLRPDLVLKPLFACALASANRSAVLHSFRCWKEYKTGTGDLLEDGQERVADNIAWLPRWAFAAARECLSCFWLKHRVRSWAVPRLGLANLAYLLPGDQHDSDSLKDWNPLYWLAGRAEGPDVYSVTRNFVCSADGLLALPPGAPALQPSPPPKPPSPSPPPRPPSPPPKSPVVAH